MTRRDAHRPARPAAETTLHIVVDLNRCQGYGQCCVLGPRVFWLHGPEALLYQPAPDASEREQVLRAAAACPVQAIHVESSADSDSTRREGSRA